MGIEVTLVRVSGGREEGGWTMQCPSSGRTTALLQLPYSVKLFLALICQVCIIACESQLTIQSCQTTLHVNMVQGKIYMLHKSVPACMSWHGIGWFPLGSNDFHANNL